MRRSRALQRQTTTTFSFCSGATMNAPHSTLFQVIKWPRRFAKTITGGWQPRGVRADNTKIIPSANFETLLVRTWSVGTCSGLNRPNPSPRLTVLRPVNPASICAKKTREDRRGLTTKGAARSQRTMKSPVTRESPDHSVETGERETPSPVCAQTRPNTLNHTDFPKSLRPPRKPQPGTCFPTLPQGMEPALVLLAPGARGDLAGGHPGLAHDGGELQR